MPGGCCRFEVSRNVRTCVRNGASTTTTTYLRKIIRNKKNVFHSQECSQCYVLHVTPLRGSTRCQGDGGDDDNGDDDGNGDDGDGDDNGWVDDNDNGDDDYSVDEVVLMIVVAMVNKFHEQICEKLSLSNIYLSIYQKNVFHAPPTRIFLRHTSRSFCSINNLNFKSKFSFFKSWIN